MNHKKLLAFCILLLMPLLAMAKGDTGDVTLNVSFTGSITLLAEDGDKQYVINSPGKAKLNSFLADKRNTVLTLTKDYVKSVVAQLRKDKTVKSRRHSDPATVTREIIIKDSTLLEVEVDSVPCEKEH